MVTYLELQSFTGYKEEESKKLAQIITNDTSRKILNSLAEKDSTESELSKDLGIPISTIHYNLQALLKTRLVEADEFHYSRKGKEILHYRLANKYIIISPKPMKGIKNKLRSILPVSLLALVSSGILFTISLIKKPLANAAVFSSLAKSEAETMTARSLADTAPKAVSDVAVLAQDTMTNSFSNTSDAIIQQSSIWQQFIHNPASWFLFGCIFTILLILFLEYLSYKKK